MLVDFGRYVSCAWAFPGESCLIAFLTFSSLGGLSSTTMFRPLVQNVSLTLSRFTGVIFWAISLLRYNAILRLASYYCDTSRHNHWAAVMSRGWAKASACRPQVSLSCDVRFNKTYYVSMQIIPSLTSP